ncbi:(4Fe-4S)-binding protein [Oceanobacillus saliphilus]|uniref:(4Fe-4S)-binding protein n=1 Tax=Oceanobacillus saliphilus TaxID=2925834 RepID=UPI00201DBDEC|nr:(4Fe-4S)-binding protein [Oceanobacillus saliphilus]
MDEKDLLENGYRKYTGEAIDVFFNKDICVHSARCVKGSPEVFNTKRKPWVLPDQAQADEVAKVIDTCPSGALKYIHNGQTEALPSKLANDYEED